MKELENHWGPQNPHPLSKIRTELVWEGKYDEYGNRREIQIAGCDMPLQKVEAIDEPHSSAEGTGQIDLFKKKSKRQDDFRNMLIWGDNKLIMASLLEDFKGKIKLIYIDPPFDVGADFTMDIPVGDEDDSLHKDQSALEMVAYRDMWGRGTDSYLHMMYERLTLMREMLTEDGSIYVHTAYQVGHATKMLLDEVFGPTNFRNEIIAKRRITKNLQRQFKSIHSLNWAHDAVLWYSKKDTNRFKPASVPMETSKPDGYWHHFWSNADRPTMRYPLLGIVPTKGQWKWSQERAERAIENYKRYLNEGHGLKLVDYWRKTEGELEFIRLSENNKVENWFPPSDERIADTLWLDIHAYENEKDYATQKHPELLERIIDSASEKGDLVADFFCGSGTTGAVAERLERRWIMCDLGRFAIHTTRKRMIEIQRQLYDEQKSYRAFDIYNLGRYERQWWQKERLAGADEEHRNIVLAFYRADKLTGSASPTLHGRKGSAFVHVDSIDSILTLTDLKPIVEATQAAGAKEVHCLAWEFEMELKRNAEALEHEYGVKVRPIRIPREVMEKNRRPGVDSVPFFEMATLSVKPIINIEGGERIVDVELTNFLPSLSEVPSKELEALKERAIKSGFDFIDFWAIDFDHQDGQPFKHHWQDYRLRKDRSLKIKSDCKHKYPDTKPHTMCVKVIDVFGCDTSILLEVAGVGSSPRRDKK